MSQMKTDCVRCIRRTTRQANKNISLPRDLYKSTSHPFIRNSQQNLDLVERYLIHCLDMFDLALHITNGIVYSKIKDPYNDHSPSDWRSVKCLLLIVIFLDFTINIFGPGYTRPILSSLFVFIINNGNQLMPDYRFHRKVY